MQVTHCAKAKRCVLEKSRVSHTPDASRLIQATVQNSLFNHQTDISLLQEWTMWHKWVWSSVFKKTEQTERESVICITALSGPSLADAGPGARYGVGPPSVRLQWRYGGGVRFRSSRGAGPGATAPVAPPKGRPWALYMKHTDCIRVTERQMFCWKMHNT